MNPHLKDFTVYDDKFLGYFMVDKHEDLNNELRNQVMDYMGLIKKRLGCRITIPHYIPEKHGPNREKNKDKDKNKTPLPEQATLARGSELNPYTYYGYDDSTSYEDFAQQNEEEYGVEAAKVEDSKVTYEANMCCGSSMWTSKPYNDLQKVCCEDGPKDWGEDDVNPCVKKAPSKGNKK